MKEKDTSPCWKPLNGKENAARFWKGIISIAYPVDHQLIFKSTTGSTIQLNVQGLFYSLGDTTQSTS
jgi:hypothetical protein